MGHSAEYRMTHTLLFFLSAASNNQLLYSCQLLILMSSSLMAVKASMKALARRALVSLENRCKGMALFKLVNGIILPEC